MASDDTSWRTPSFRQGMASRIEEAIQKSGMPTAKNSSDMESHVFMKAKNKEEYLSFIARLILHVREMNSKKQGGGMAPGGNGPNQGMSDPIGALQTLARQGTGNNQMMGIPNTGANPQGMVPQPNTNAATNLLQSLNQRPGQGVNMPGMQNKMPGMGIMPGQATGAVGHIGQMQGMQNSSILTQINQIGQGNMPQQMVQIGPGQMGQMGTQMGGGQSQQNIQNQIPNQVPGQMGGSMGGGLQSGIQNNLQTGMQQQMNQMGTGQIGANQLQQQMHSVQRKPPEMMNVGFPGPRNVTPNQFLNQSPSPSAPSPGGLGAPQSNQMVPSPALAPSPMSQPSVLSGQRSVGMAPSPSSSLNTPAGMGTAPSPMEDHVYKETLRRLTKYIEPLRKMITRLNGEGNADKTAKMKKLLEILSNPSKRMPVETLQKCEIALEKMDFSKRGDGSVGPALATLKENHFFSPLLEAVSSHLQSPVANHTLQRTFGPCIEAFFGPEIKNLPPPLKRQKVEESTSEIPDVLQGEIARLDQRFKVSLDPAQQTGSLCIQLICWLDDRHLPCVPPVSVSVPADYPLTPPRCVMAPHEYTTAFLSGVKDALTARISKLPKQFSVSQLLDTWEMSVRQASAPSSKTPTSTGILMGT
ncbi:mediator of RNA polymerase II transcription subunit 15 [Leptopilina boulardi]|uniref:mediator of RNA polymerase II transcription subunit 15 n=1 Tax=Leptopilina boulardi TaxID=63433 RepID=UPI0021F6790A|nr:mediator of RNA polymerase II transcription subunit 15 [Leptopilina boulardi]XP_051168894.1 mediator of RNA polymerase II transcription subunit 15 [Leptopilina boulardi]XP_051168895.1 mediator of RNA polymerase II transcription subunit 15 [Leptopilina boulardi]XP_051168896.1 mediator of RNA polymerase II transcription subunit 15 [Leptopilina boulardi]XP_051168899.1 mediator of RNA polymerase II transcription subunit 15 [Leptopilina boulardi]